MVRGNGPVRDRAVQQVIAPKLPAARRAVARYHEVVGSLRQLVRSLALGGEPQRIRPLVDRTERGVLDLRRALWDLRQAVKTVPGRVSVRVPVLQAPIEFEVLSDVKKGEQLFFTFRRF